MEQSYVILPDGLHIWNPSHDLSGVPEDIIERESAGYGFSLMQNPEWRKLETGNVTVMGDIPDQALKGCAITAEELRKMLEREIGGPKQSDPYLIRVFQDKAQFCAYATQCGGQGAAYSIYVPRKKEMSVHFSLHTHREDFEETFAHEFTHAYMDKIYRVTEPLWFAEGMAEYFSRSEWTSKGFMPTGQNQNAAMHGEDVVAITLRDLLTAGRNDIYGIKFPAYYAACWAVVSFLLKKHPEVIEALLRREIINISLLADEYSRYIKRRLGV